MKQFYLFLLLSLSVSAFAQRYRTSQFSELEIDSLTYALDGKRELQLDFIQPKGDSLKNRPLILFMHGGSFKAGFRNKEDVYNYCKAWAHRGYTVATITYRLTLKGKSFHCDQTKEVKINTFKEASYDLHRATAFLIEKHDSLGFDPNTIILSGNSAGGEAVLQGAFLNKEQLIKDVLPKGFSYAGLLSYAGAIIDTNLITKKNSIPMGLFHGTCDQWVPYNVGTHHYCPKETPGAIILHGSKSIAKRLKNLNESYYLHSLCGMDHIVNKTALVYQFDTAVDFVYFSILNKQKKQQHFIEKSQSKNCKYGTYHFCE